MSVLLALGFLAACSGSGKSTGAGPATTTVPNIATLKFAVTSKENNLTPFTTSTGYPGYYMSTLVYDTLFWLDPDGQPQPWLVRDHQVSPDGLRWTLNLRDGVTWHDGRPLTSADVRFTIEYLKKYPRPRFTPPLAPITAIETPTPQTVVLTLSEPKASFLLVPLSDLTIIPEHVWSTIDKPLDVTTQLPIGSGPYRLVEYTPDRLWRFQANPTYFRGKPIVNEIVMPFIAEPQTAFSAVQSGEVDAAAPSLTPELKSAFNQGPVKTVGGAGYRGWYLYMNTGRPPFDRKELRQALTLSVDTDDIVRTLLLGAGATGSPGYVHRSAPWSNPARRDQRADQAKARALLDGIGFRDANNDGTREGADGQALAFDLLVRTNDPIAPRAAELVRDSAAKIGIKLNVVGVDMTASSNRIWPDYNVGQFKGDYFVGLHSWAASVQQDPEQLRTLFHSNTSIGTLNRAAYKNPEYDALADRQSRTVDQAQRAQLLFQMQDILAQDLPAYPIYFQDDIFPYRPGTFDRWVYYKGTGILNKATFLP